MLFCFSRRIPRIWNTTWLADWLLSECSLGHVLCAAGCFYIYLAIALAKQPRSRPATLPAHQHSRLAGWRVSYHIQTASIPHCLPSNEPNKKKNSRPHTACVYLLWACVVQCHYPGMQPGRIFANAFGIFVVHSMRPTKFAFQICSPHRKVFNLIAQMCSICNI